jgi:hypothetical protein
MRAVGGAVQHGLAPAFGSRGWAVTVRTQSASGLEVLADGRSNPFQDRRLSRCRLDVDDRAHRGAGRPLSFWRFRSDVGLNSRRHLRPASGDGVVPAKIQLTVGADLLGGQRHLLGGGLGIDPGRRGRRTGHQEQAAAGQSAAGKNFQVHLDCYNQRKLLSGWGFPARPNKTPRRRGVTGRVPL